MRFFVIDLTSVEIGNILIMDSNCQSIANSKHSRGKRSSSNRGRNIAPGDPLDLLKGISDLFVSYQPNFGYEHTLEFSNNPRCKLLNVIIYIAGWNLISHSILNKFAPRNSIFIQELKKKREDEEKLAKEIILNKNGKISNIKERQKSNTKRNQPTDSM